MLTHNHTQYTRIHTLPHNHPQSHTPTYTHHDFRSCAKSKINGIMLPLKLTKERKRHSYTFGIKRMQDAQSPIYEASYKNCYNCYYIFCYKARTMLLHFLLQGTHNACSLTLLFWPPRPLLDPDMTLELLVRWISVTVIVFYSWDSGLKTENILPTTRGKRVKWE